jgi:hypothetical protein
MANFALVNSTNFAAQATMGTSYLSVIVCGASSLAFNNPATVSGVRRGKIYDILIGTNTTPADNAIEWAVARATIGTTAIYLGTVSSVSSLATIDPGDVVFSSFLGVNSSAGSTAVISQTAQLWYVGINQRASYRWVAAPGSEFVWPATTSAAGNNGMQLMARSPAYVSTVTATVLGTEV